MVARNKGAGSKPKTPAGGTPSVQRRLLIALGVLVLVGVVLFFPIAAYTDQPSFCPSCHDMQPFYSAWQTGPHRGLWCVDCHVNAGYPNRFLHKFAALQEVAAELFGHPAFPNYNADMTNDRCLRCHPDVPTKIAAVGQFWHQMHLDRGVACATCHATVGHKVTFAALSAAGVLRASQVASGATFVGETFAGVPGQHSALPGHRAVPCSNCHDQANLQCSFCHTPPANHFGADCKQCHDPRVPFAQFQHPPVPAPHGIGNRTCAQCHPNGFTTVFCTCHNGHPPND